MATEPVPARRKRAITGMDVAVALLEALGVPPRVVRARDATLYLPIDGLPVMNIDVPVLADDDGETVKVLAAALKEAGLVVHVYPVAVELVT